jgi:hypothetical protein
VLEVHHSVASRQQDERIVETVDGQLVPLRKHVPQPVFVVFGYRFQLPNKSVLQLVVGVDLGLTVVALFLTSSCEVFLQVKTHGAVFDGEFHQARQESPQKGPHYLQ